MTPPFIMRAVYGPRPPTLLVVLRDPIDRLEFSYWYHVHYPKRCAGLELT
jgi:hypothetical protein